MKIIGYIRVSSNKQTLQHQHYEIKDFCKKENIKVSKWVEETISSKKALSKRKLGNLLNNLQDGDILIACEISRLGRSLLEVMHILEICLNKGCRVWTIKENYRLGNDIQSKVLAFAFALAAEIERNLISQRTKASLENIKANGKKLGRPLTKDGQRLNQPENIKQIKALLDKNTSLSEIARIFQVNRSLIRHLIQKIKPVETK